MAHHRNTQQTVLDAPERDEEWLIWYRNPNRVMRRHWRKFPLIFKPGKNGQPTVTFPEMNKPYERDQ